MNNDACKHQVLADKFRKYGSPSALPWIFCDECSKPVHQETLKQIYPKDTNVRIPRQAAQGH